MKVHVLGGNDGLFNIVTHQVTPAGNNSAGLSWAAVIVASGMNHSILTVGTGPGQTTQAEMDGIVAGTVIEGKFSFNAPSNLTGGQLATMLDEQAAVILANQLTDLAERYKWYGATRA
jgi:hypothetical protein